LGLNFAGDVLGEVARWIGESSFLLTTYTLLFFNLTLPPLLFASAIYGTWALFECRVGWLLRWSLIFYLVHNLAFYTAVSFGSWKSANFGTLSLPFIPVFSCILIIFLLRHAWSKSGELRWLALSFIPFFVTLLITSLSRGIPILRDHLDPNLLYLLYSTAHLFAVIAFGFLLMRRSGRARAEQDRLHAEMEAARQVQRLMLPAQSVDAPHVHINTAYLPSQEVGGDFYQIATGDDGAILLIIGDVSGKGLQAALTMSLIVGLWQEVVSTVQSPSEILCRFNHYLQRRLSGGFVTCLCARLQPDGQLTIANAGHLAPYLNGMELTILNGLPLGISAENEYEESHHLLSPTDTLVLISDGIVEARDKTHSFYGFERLQQTLSEHLGAEAIARRAQQFGQEDDITVIAISPRAMVTESSTAQTAVALGG
jgi:Stage II sporulation protein E (SpoIIE)